MNEPAAAHGAHDGHADAVLAGVVYYGLVLSVEEVVLHHDDLDRALGTLEYLEDVRRRVVRGDADVSNEPLLLGLARLVQWAFGSAYDGAKRAGQDVVVMADVYVVGAEPLQHLLKVLPPELAGRPVSWNLVPAAADGHLVGDEHLFAGHQLQELAHCALALSPVVNVGRVVVVDPELIRPLEERNRGLMVHGLAVVSLRKAHATERQR